MTTLAKDLQTGTPLFSTTHTVAKPLSAYGRFIENLQFSHFALIAMSILFGSCLGSIATMKIFENDAPLWQFILSVSVTMANLVGCISQAPTKWVVRLFGLSLIVNTILLVVNVI